MKIITLCFLIPAIIQAQQLFKVEFNDTLLLLKKFSFEDKKFQVYDLLYTKDDQIFKVSPSSFQIHNDTIPSDATYHRNWWDTQIASGLIFRSTRIDTIVYPVYVEPEIADPKYLYNIKAKELIHIDSSLSQVTYFDGSYFAYRDLKKKNNEDVEVYINWQKKRTFSGASAQFFKRSKAFFLVTYYQDSTVILKYDSVVQDFKRCCSLKNLKEYADPYYDFVLYKGSIKVFDRFLSAKYQKNGVDLSINDFGDLTEVITFPSPDTCLTDYFFKGKFIKSFCTTEQWPYSPQLLPVGDRWYTVLFNGQSLRVLDEETIVYFETDNRWYTYYIIND